MRLNTYCETAQRFKPKCSSKPAKSLSAWRSGISFSMHQVARMRSMLPRTVIPFDRSSWKFPTALCANIVVRTETCSNSSSFALSALNSSAELAPLTTSTYTRSATITFSDLKNLSEKPSVQGGLPLRKSIQALESSRTLNPAARHLYPNHPESCREAPEYPTASCVEPYPEVQ